MNSTRVCAVWLPLALCVSCQAEWESVDDGFGEADPNQIPTVIITTPLAGDQFKSDELIRISGAASDDAAPDQLSVTLYSTVDGDLGEAEVQPSGVFSAEVQLSAGTHEVTVTATDAGALSASSGVDFVVAQNQAPGPPVVEVIPSNPTTANDLEAFITDAADDPDGDGVTYIWSWTVDGVDADVSGSVVSDTMTSEGQTWEVQLVATDGDLESEPAIASVRVADGGPRVDVSMSPSRATTEDSLYCDWDILEPDSLPFTVEAAWMVNAVWVADAYDGATTQPLTSGFEKNDEVTCEVTATSDTGSNSDSASLVIVNAAPVMEDISVLPTSATVETVLTCSAIGSDPDGDALTYSFEWYVNETITTTSETLNGGFFARGDLVSCQARASDSEATSAALATGSLTIQNAPPTTPAVELDASEVLSGQTLACSLSTFSSDPDGDVMSYEWRWGVDGTIQPETTSSFNTGGLSGVEVTCQARATDGIDASPWSAEASAMVTSLLEGTQPTADADVTITNTEAGANFCRVVAAGDVDGDGLGDLIVGANAADSDAGAIYFFSGADVESASTDADASWHWLGAAGDGLGGAQSLSVVGDVDGDGLQDLGAGAHFADDRANNGGAAYLLLSGERAGWGAGGLISDDAALIVSGESASDYCGISTGGGDIDGDGDPEFLVGCYYEDEAASNAGALAIFSGATLPTGAVTYSSADFLLIGDRSNDYLGWDAKVLGDLDGDGLQDLAVSGYNMDGDLDSNSGVVFLVTAAALADGAASDVAFARLEGAVDSDRFGWSIEGVADLDGDGVHELLIGAERADDAATDGGAVTLWYGGAGLTGTLGAGDADYTWAGQADADYLGRRLASGDMNGDGRDEIVMAAPYADDGETNAGTVFLLTGGAAWGGGDPADDAQAIIYATAGTDLLGTGLAIGDMNGDGAGDIIMGAERGDAGGTDAGTVYVFFGP